MDQYTLDPYEQQLLKVFDSHDRDNCGSLDRDGLSQLCQTLQLEEQGAELVKCLLRNKQSRVTFTEFKDALLALLGNMQNNKNGKNEELNKDSEKTSPEREVSPKFVYGSKKYGRRSRPRNEEEILSNRSEITHKPPISVQRSNSQTEVSSKKRKTNYKLKRCTSLPGNNDLLINNIDSPFMNSHVLSNDSDLIFTEDMLREAWRKLGVGKDGYLNQTELVLVCDAIGLHKLANGVIRQLSDKFTLNYDHRISFQELLEVLQQDDTWFEVLNQTSTQNEPLTRQSTDNLFPDSRTFQFVTLGPDGNGIISTDVLIEMWENVGIHSPKELLHELGFNVRSINIVELAEVLDAQIKGINESTRTEYHNPQTTLLQANLALYQSEIKCFKTILEQMNAEREKLKCDVIEANNRATMLAQEVDDNHSRMEQNTLNQVKLLEQRHSDILKEITTQFSKDKEQLSLINQNLEDRISSLEQEVAKLKNDLLVAQKYSLSIEQENQVLSVRITELEKDKDSLSVQISILENEKQKFSELEQEESKMLIARLNALKLENSKLKDKNDEMVSEIESLSNQVTSMRMKNSSTPTPNTLDQSMEENISIICEGVGIGAKRRSDYSPSKDIRISDGSPRLGKIRKFHKNKTNNLEVPFTSSESGFDTEIDGLDSSLSSIEYDEVIRLQAKIAFLEQVLVQNSIPVPNFETTISEVNTSQLTSHIKQLERVINETKAEIARMLEKDCVNCDNLRKCNQKLGETFCLENCITRTENDYVEVASQTDFIDYFEEKVKKLEDENQELYVKCSELENCVELLKNEYEKCEEYWQNKVDDERQMFETEQKINSDKLTELILKMREYEEQYASQDTLESRLPTITETYNLEKQFTDLEQEFEEYRLQSETEICRKDEEIAHLKEKLTELALKQQQSQDIGVQVQEEEHSKILNKMQGFASYVVERTSLLSEDMLPPSNLPPNNLEYANPSWEQQTKTSTPINWNFNNTVPSTSSSSGFADLNTTPCRPKRTRKHDKNLYKKNNHEKEMKKKEEVSNKQEANKNLEQTVVLPLSSFHSLTGRKNYLEQRVRHLQMCIKQQHYCSEQTLQHYWLQFKGERADLHSKLKYLQEKLDQQVRISNEQLSKLERTDMLVKDLYIENSYLIANVQRLEQQCHMIARHNSHFTSI